MMNNLDQIYKKIEQSDSIVIFGHVLPDGDCYGSQIGLREIIKDTFPNKRVYSVGTGIPNLFSRLAPMDEVNDEIIRSSLAILIDATDCSRSEDSRIVTASNILKIDHHLESVPFDELKWVDVNSIAACQMVAEFAESYRMKISKLAAECLFVGIVTDSGRFMYPPTDEKTHSIVASLYHLGVDSKSLFDILYQVDENSFRYKGYLSTHYTKTERGVLFIYVPKEIYHSFGLTFDRASGLVNVLASIKGCPIWSLFTENEDGTIRVELRSSGACVQKVAVQFSGGGHHQASGAKLPGGGLPSVMKVVEALDQLLESEGK